MTNYSARSVHGTDDPTGNGQPRNRKLIPAAVAPSWHELRAAERPYFIGDTARRGLRCSIAEGDEPSDDQGVLTQDVRTAPDVVALTAHGHPAILALEIGDPLEVFADQIKRYVVRALFDYRLVDDPYRTTTAYIARYGQYKSLADGRVHSVPSLHKFFYQRSGPRCVLSTCIFRDDNPMWGRRLVVAEPD